MQYMIQILLITLWLSSAAALNITEDRVTRDWDSLSSQLSQITELELFETDLSEASFVKVLSHDMPQLKKLTFCPITTEELIPQPSPSVLNPKVIETLFRSKYFPGLLELDLSSTSLDSRAFYFLDNLTSPLKVSLEVLHINNLLIGKSGYQRLARIDFQGHLKQLKVTNTLLVEEEAVDYLLKIICRFQNSTCQSQLQLLDIGFTELSREGFIKIIRTINSTSLQSLSIDSLFLHRNKVYSQGSNYTAFEVLAGIPFPNLLNLTLRESGFSNEAAKVLSGWQVPNLRVLTASKNPLGDEGIKALLTLKSKPHFQNLAVFGTNITDETMQYMRLQNFTMKSFNFGKTKITDKGFSQLKKMDLSKMVRFILNGVYIKESTLLGVINSMNASSLELMHLMDLNGMKTLLNKIDWQNFPRLRILLIGNINLEDSFTEFFTERKALVESLEQIGLVKVGMGMQQFNVIAILISKWFPNIRFVSLMEDQQIPVIIPLLKQNSDYKDGVTFEFGYVKFRKDNNKYTVLKLSSVMYLFIDLAELSQAKAGTAFTIQDMVDLLLTVVNFYQLTTFQISSYIDMELIKMILKTAKITSLPRLHSLAAGFEINTEVFFSLFDSNTFPHLTALGLHLTVPGDASESFVRETLIPFFGSFPNMAVLEIGLSFLNQEEGLVGKRELMESMDYPFLTNFMAAEQEMTTEDLATLLVRHGDTLRNVNLNGNFLENGFLDLLIRFDLRPLELKIGKIFFTVEEFGKLGKLDLSFTTGIDIIQNDLTDEHMLAVIANNEEAYFPNLQTLMLEENDIGRAGLQAWLQTGMPNLKKVDMENNRNPSFVNLLLKYPNKIEIILAQNIEVYSLDKDISPESVHQVTVLSLKTFSFSEEDFRVLGGLEFTSLADSVLYMSNIYDCESLKNFMRINRWANLILNVFQNDEFGLNSSCLKDYGEWKSRVKDLVIKDDYGSTYLPQYIEMLANSQQDIELLQISKARLSSASLTRILSNKFDGVKLIDISYSYLTDEALTPLLSNDLDHLFYLDFTSTSITSEAIRKLAIKGLPSLGYLILSGNRLDTLIAQSLEILSQTLVTLQLNNCDLESSMLEALVEIAFPNLSSLELSYNQFTEESAVKFLVSLQKRKMPNLQTIELKGVSLSKQNYETVVRVLTTKQIANFQLQRPYNIVQPNSAGY